MPTSKAIIVMHHHALPRATRRNFRLNIVNGAVTAGSENSVGSPDRVMTTFAAHLTDNPILLGLITPLPGAMWSLPQLFIIPAMQRRARVLPIYRAASFVRVTLWAVLALAALFSRDTTILLLTLFSFLLIAGLAGGVAGLPFIEVTGKTIPPSQRGHVFGLRVALGGVLAIAGSQVVIFFTGPGSAFDFPVSFGMLFLVATVAQAIGQGAFTLVDEPDADTNIIRTRPSLNVFGSIWRSDGNFRRYVWGRTFAVLGGMASGLVIVYANQQLGVRLEMAGIYLFASSLLSPVFSMLAGRMSVRTGNRLPVAGGMLMMGLGWAMLLLAKPLGVREGSAETFMFVVYALLALHKGLLFSNMMALGLNITPEGDHALYMGAVNTWIGVLLLVTTLSGAIARLIGYEALFALTLACAAISAWAFVTLVEDWRDEAVVAT
ncbi:MAG: MFS transporter [Chloroflexi bacterium]|nr:MAG: MFS transporter [Chloroflexota bacterium]